MPAALRAAHIIGFILWMGGLFQLARHLGMHADLEETRDELASWETSTYFGTVLPGLLLTLGTGLWLFVSRGPEQYLNTDGPWGATFHLKLMLVVILIGIDLFVQFRMRRLHRSGEGNRGLFMALHGVVGLCFIVIVVAVKTRALA
ncbi:MAG: CopD family protein [Bradymonadaceae bacterium]